MEPSQMKPKQNALLWVALVAGGILAGAGILLGCGIVGYLVGSASSTGSDNSSSASRSSGPAVGEVAPDFELVSLEGESVLLSDLRGKPVLLNFWASWCGPCVMEMDLIQAQQDAYSSDLVILAVNVDDSIATVRSFAEDEGLTFTILLDEDGDVQSQYRVSAIPISYFIDAEGVIQAVHLGGLDESQISRYLLLLGVGQ